MILTLPPGSADPTRTLLGLQTTPVVTAEGTHKDVGTIALLALQVPVARVWISP
jgi:hypothetical protein